MLSLSRDSTNNRIFWWGDSWTDYVVESSTNLTDWQNDGSMSGDGNEKGAYTYVNTCLENHKFYRVKFSRVLPHVNISVDPSSPFAGLAQISTTAMTQNVPLAVYDVKVINAPATLRGFTVTITTTGNDVTNLFTGVKLRIGSQTYSSSQIGLPGDCGTNITVVFSNMAIPLSADTYVPITIIADVSQDANNSLDGSTATTSINAWGTPNLDTQYRHSPDVEDVSNNLISVEETYVHSSVLTFTGAGAFISNTSANLGPAIRSSDVVVAYPMSFGFTVTAGDQTLFVSASPTTFTDAVAGIGAIVNLPLTGVVANPAYLPGDFQTTSSSGYYVIPAGSSRQFTFNGSIGNTDGVHDVKSVSIVDINYGTSTSNLTAHTVSYGLQNLRVYALF